MNFSGDEVLVTAKKVHNCSWCGEAILKGEKYERTFIVYEGDAWTRKLHVECAKANVAYLKTDYDELFYEGQFERGHSHEHNWDTLPRQAADGCPACIELLATILLQPKEPHELQA